MSDLNHTTAKSEKRKEARKVDDTFVLMKPLDEKEKIENISLVIDKSEAGTALITHIPLPIGTRVEIRAGDDFTAIGEVTDWDWNAQTDLVRLGVRLVEKTGNWPNK